MDLDVKTKAVILGACFLIVSMIFQISLFNISANWKSSKEKHGMTLKCITSENVYEEELEETCPRKLQL